MHGDGDIPFVVLLKLKRDGDAVCKVKCWRVMGKVAVVAEKPDVLDHKEFGAAFLGLGDLAVLTQSHCEEESPDRQLAHCFIEGGIT